MRHYEIVFLVDSNQKEKISTMLEKHSTIIEKDGGKIHRIEEWGRKQLTYPIKNNSHAFYILMNIECSLEALGEIEKIYRFSEAILRNLIIKKDKAETGESFMLIEQRKQQESKEKNSSESKPSRVHEPDPSIKEESASSEKPEEKTKEEQVS